MFELEGLSQAVVRQTMLRFGGAALASAAQNVMQLANPKANLVTQSEQDIGRSRRPLRGRHADRIDRTDQAERLADGEIDTRDKVVGYGIVEAAGGEVLIVEILPGFRKISLVDRACGGGA